MLSYYDNKQEMHSKLRSKEFSFITQTRQIPMNRRPLSEMEKVVYLFYVLNNY